MRDVGAAPALGSNVHRSFPVAASRANTRSFGVVPKSTPSMTMGFVCISDPGNSSWVAKVQATLRRFTLAGVIWSRVEKWE